MMMFGSNKIDSFAMKKDTYISVSIDLAPHKAKKVAKKAAVVLPPKIEEPAVSEDVDINDLFSDVWTKKIPNKKIAVKNNRRLDELQKKIKKTEANSVEPIEEKYENIETKENEKNSATASTAEQVNEYLAKIQAIVYKYFNVPASSEGHFVKAVIELNALGKMTDFRILTYSANDALNKEVDKIKARLRSVIFPINPQNKSSRTVVILKSKE